jgi:hypothetical protein
MLQTAFERGRDGALSRFGVKAAAVPLARPMPAARGLAAPAPQAAAPAASHTPAGPQPGYSLSPHEEAQAMRIKKNPASGPQELGLDQLPASPAAPAAATASRGGGVGRFMRPMKRGLGLAALGAGGALAYGLHHGHQQDQEKNLVYAPLQGGF